MGKSKLKNHKPEEHNLGTIRSQKKEIQKLHQRIKHLEKELGYRQNKTEDESEPEVELKLCTDCGKGHLREIIILQRSIWTCDTCFFRTKARKL